MIRPCIHEKTGNDNPLKTRCYTMGWKYNYHIDSICLVSF